MWASIRAGFGVACTNAAIRTGDPGLLGNGTAALESALARTSRQHRRFPFLAAALSTALRERYQRQHAPADLDRAVELVRQAAAAALPGHPRYGWVQMTLARTLTLHAAETGDASGLDDAVEAGLRSLEGSASRRRDVPERQTVLAIALKTRYDLTGNDRDLADSIVHIRAAENGQLRDKGDRVTVAANYALSYMAIFQRYGRLADLDSAIENLAMVASSPGAASRRQLVNLSYALRLRHRALGRHEDIDAAIRAARQAAGSGLFSSPEVAATLSDALAARSRSAGEPGDLDESIVLGGLAADLAPDGGSRRGALLSLGQLLTIRYEDHGNPADIEQAVDNLRAALAEVSQRDPGRVAYLDSLGHALWARYEGGAGSPEDVAESVRLLEAAVAGTPDDHREADARRGNLAAALWTRFGITHDPRDLDAAIDHGEKALDAPASTQADQTGLLLNLGIAHKTRFDDRGDLQDALRAITLWRQATRLPDIRAGMRIGSARNWGELAMRTGDLETAVAGYGAAIQMLPEVAWRGLSTAGQHWILASWRGLASEAAAAALSAGQAGKAVEMAETGRSVSWGHALARHVSLDDLRGCAPELADRITRVRDAMASLQA